MSAFRVVLYMMLYLIPLQVVAAQAIDATLEGTITDEATGLPVASAHVFIAASQKGTTTNAKGQYRLTGIPLGASRLYVSIVGYEPVFLDLFIQKAEVQRHDFALKEAIVSLGDITIEEGEDKEWRKQLAKFIRLFIGETPNAAQTTLVNPEVLSFTNKGGRFQAFAEQALVLENQALGYRITYFLQAFEATSTRTKYAGEPLFEPLSPKDPQQAARWHEARQEAFYGSFRHFMLTLLDGRLEEEGFEIYSRPAPNSMTGTSTGIFGSPKNQRYPLDPATLLKPGSDDSHRMLAFEGLVDIVFTLETEDKAYLDWSGQPYRAPRFRTSSIQVAKGPTLVDLKGDTLDPFGVTFYGYLAFERVGDQLPKEYRPE